jgi:nitroreductase
LKVLEAIHSRSSIGKLSDQLPSREQIEQLLDAAIRAPNHHVTEPWRFFVVAGDARAELGDLMADLLAKTLDDPTADRAQNRLRQERSKPLRAPVLIIVAASPSREGKVIEAEEVTATAAAVQNILLTAHDMGLGAQWRTGGIAYDSSINRWLGLDDVDQVIAIVYLGHPAMSPRHSKRQPASDLTKWIGWTE